MRVTLVYNARSGTAASEGEVRGGLSRLGWKVERCLSKNQIDDGLTYRTDVVVVAGGDGTVGKVAKRLAGTDVPMAIVPMGTANNVARSLGIGVDASAALLGLARALERRVDLGVVQSREARDYFLEAFGIGVFAQIVAAKAKTKDKTLRNAVGLLADELEAYKPRNFELEVDGRDLSGRYVLAAVMNARSLGPTLGVAPEAKCDDGELDVALIRPNDKSALVAHLRRAAQEGDVFLPPFETARAKSVRIRADGRWAHIDDAPCRLEGDVCIDVDAGAVTVLTPAERASAPSRTPSL